MKIRYLGHSSFMLTESTGTTIVTDPYGAIGFKMPSVKADGMLGLPAQACLVVEDAPAGLEAARAAGMDCAGVGGADWPFAPAYTLPDVTALPAALLD